MVILRVTSSHKSQSLLVLILLDPTPQRDRCHHAEDQSPGSGGEARDETGEARAEGRRRSSKPYRSFRRDVQNEGDFGLVVGGGET